MNIKDRDYYLAGAAIALASTAALLTYTIKRAKTGTAGVGLLLAGLAGYALGAAAATEPSRAATRRLVVEDLLDDADTERVQTNISEIFGNSADRGTEHAAFRAIEVDEDATIEDFL